MNEQYSRGFSTPAANDSESAAFQPSNAEMSGEGGTSSGEGMGQTAQQTIQDTKEAAKDTVQQVAGDVQAQAGEVIDQAATQAGQVVGQAKAQASSALADQQQRAVSGLTGLADALRQTGSNLRESDDQAQAGIGQWVEDAAERLTQSADFLRDKSPDQLLNEVQQFARKQPMLFVGALFGVGLVGARLLKGSMDGGSQGTEMQDLTDRTAGSAQDTFSSVSSQVDEMLGSTSTGGWSAGNASAQGDFTNEPSSSFDRGAGNASAYPSEYERFERSEEEL